MKMMLDIFLNSILEWRRTDMTKRSLGSTFKHSFSTLLVAAGGLVLCCSGDVDMMRLFLRSILFLRTLIACTVAGFSSPSMLI